MARRSSRLGVVRPMSVSARLSLLSAKRREVIQPALEHPRECVLLSVRALAERLGTDPATMVRIVRGMQFASYRDFQHYLHELSIAHATSLDTMQSGSRRTVPMQSRVALEQDQKNLNRLAQSLDPNQVIGLVKRIYKARKIVLLGGDLAANLVNFLGHHLMMLGLPVSTATYPAEVVHRVRLVGKKDLVIGISYGRGLRQTVEGLRQARANHAYCVGVTNTLVSPIVQFSDECFLTAVDSPSFVTSYVAPVALFHVILAACANYKQSRTLALMKKVADEERHGFRWYESL